jgi:hypothetical protein
MVLVLKLVSFAIWFIIMLFIVGAAIHRKRRPLGNLAVYQPGHGKSRSSIKTDKQQSG